MKRLKPPGCQNLPALESAASTASCGASSTALTPESEICCGTSCRSRTSRSSVAPLPWKNTTITPGLRASKCLGDVHQHAVVVVGLVLPVDPAGIAAVAVAVALGDVEERRVGARIVAEIGEGGGFHADQRGQVFALGRTLVGSASARARRRGTGAVLRLRCGALGGGDLPRRCRCDGSAFACGREAILELRRREAVLERVAGWRLRIRGEHAGARRLAALNQDERQRHHSAATQPAIQRERIARHGRACREITGPRDQLCNFGSAPTIHPLPQDPTDNPASCRARWRLGDVKLPEKLPTPEASRRPRNRVAIVGRPRVFAMP